LLLAAQSSRRMRDVCRRNDDLRERVQNVCEGSSAVH
jgi:hypothetical protein